MNFKLKHKPHNKKVIKKHKLVPNKVTVIDKIKLTLLGNNYKNNNKRVGKNVIKRIIIIYLFL